VSKPPPREPEAARQEPAAEPTPTEPAAPESVDPSDPNFPPPPSADSSLDAALDAPLEAPAADALPKRDSDTARAPLPNALRPDGQSVKEPQAEPSRLPLRTRDYSGETEPAGEPNELAGTVISGTVVPPSEEPAASMQTPRKPRASRASQPLALLALVVALVIAAAASIFLARANGDSVFANVDEVTKSLGLPVVGVISTPAPVAAGKVAHGAMWRAFWLVVQLMLAIAVFAVVAYLIENPQIISLVLSDPVEAMQRVTRIASLR
jgi:hypothetical protein